METLASLWERISGRPAPAYSLWDIAREKLAEETADTHVEYTNKNGKHIEYERESGGKKDSLGNEIIKVSGIKNINAKEFEAPTRSFELPKFDKKFAEAAGLENKPVLLKKHTIERMAKEHPEMGSGENRRRILNNALYNFSDIIYSNPYGKPSYYVFVKNGKHYDISVIDTDKNKRFFEVVDWREINEKGYQDMIKKMEREDGQFLITDGQTILGSRPFCSSVPCFKVNSSQ